MKELFDLIQPLENVLNSIKKIKEEKEELVSKNEIFEILKSDEWPLAVNSDQIVNENSEEEKEERAEAILDIIESLYEKTDLKILDYGCGEGHLVKLLNSNGNISTGYDIKKQGLLEWEIPKDDFLLTTNWEKIKENAPYDFVILFDVIDHLEEENPLETLLKIKSILKSNGTLFCRLHPWCSKHGSHLYKQINKAFIHLVLTEDELKELNYIPQPTGRVLKPLETYNKLFSDSGFSILNKKEERMDLNPFFKENKKIASRIKKTFENKVNDFPQFQLEFCFIDYTVKLK